MNVPVMDPVLGPLPLLLAYLDPGTGSLLFSIVMGSVTAAYFALKGMWYQSRIRLRKAAGMGQVDAGDSHSLVIYSEGRQYASTFRPLLEELDRRGIGCLYLSSDEGDPLLQAGLGSVRTRFIGNGYLAWGYLNTLRADLCLMTTPGLDVLQIRRSRHVRHYSHIIHSPTDKAFNRPYSFDYYDSIFLCGPHQRQTLQFLEKLRGIPPKSMFIAGCPYYDEMLEALKTVRRSGSQDRTSVLVAPTWGKNGLLKRYGMRLLQPLLDSGMRVVVRPHPQSRVAEPELLLELEELTCKCKNLEWDATASPLEAMVRSDILVSDISGIVFDYAFLTEKPVITLDFQPEKRGFEASDLPYDPWELRVLDVVGRKIDESQLDELPQLIAGELAASAKRGEVRRLRDECVVNFGAAASPIVDELERILSRLQARQPVLVSA